jgi:methionyl-tRNA synthetase
VNNIGNLVQRSLAMIYKNCDAKIPAGIEHSHTHIEPFIENYFQAFDDLAFDKAMQAVIDFANLVNKKFNDTAPWNFKKLGKIDEMNASLHETAESLRLIAILLAPFTPVSANKILDLLMERDGMTHSEAEEYYDFNIIGGYFGEMNPVFLDRTVKMVEEDKKTKFVLI